MSQACVGFLDGLFDTGVIQVFVNISICLLRNKQTILKYLSLCMYKLFKIILIIHLDFGQHGL